MKSLSSMLAVAVFAAALVACEASPTEPQPSYEGPPWLVQISEWSFGTTTTTARVRAHWFARATPSIDVTTRATWESSAPHVLRVDAPGRLVGMSPGDADVRVTYRGVSDTQYMRVFEGEPPWPAYRAEEAVEFHGTVRDNTSVGLAGVRVDVIGGHNAGKTATTGTGGGYILHSPLVCGPITVRASKAGYHDATASSVMCRDGMPNVVMIPE